MSTTTSKTQTYQRLLEKMGLNTLADVLRKLKWGRTIAPIKVVVTGLTAADTIVINTAAIKAAATITGIDLETGEYLPPIGHVVSFRISAGGATHVGSYGVTDAGGTAIVPPGGASAALGIVKLSDDGTTLTPAASAQITAFTLIYYPKLDAAMTADPDFTGGAAG